MSPTGSIWTLSARAGDAVWEGCGAFRKYGFIDSPHFLFPVTVSYMLKNISQLQDPAAALSLWTRNPFNQKETRLTHEAKTTPQLLSHIQRLSFYSHITQRFAYTNQCAGYGLIYQSQSMHITSTDGFHLCPPHKCLVSAGDSQISQTTWFPFCHSLRIQTKITHPIHWTPIRV